MKQMTAVTGFCALVFLTGASLAQARTPDRRGKHQDEQFLRTIAIEDMTEAHLAQMAESKAAKPEVKELGQTIAKDKTEEYEQLTVLASKVGESIPKGIDARKDPAIHTLVSMKGGAFDRDFLRDEITEDRKMISTLQRETVHGENPDIKAWAEKMVDMCQQELQKERSLAR
jgi:putative membrane protein